MISSVIYTWKQNLHQNIQIVKEGYFLFLISVNILHIVELAICPRGCRGRDRMPVGFTTTCAISANHHWSCEFESHSWLVVHRSSETSTNQSDVIVRSDDRFWFLVSKIYMHNFILCVFFVFILTKILQFYPSWVFFVLILTNIFQFCPSVLLTLSQYTYLN